MAVFRTTQYTVECRNNTFQYNMRLNKALDCLMQNLHQSYHSQKTAHSSPTKVSCVVFLVQNKGNIDRIKTASHFILILPIQVWRLGPFSIYFFQLYELSQLVTRGRTVKCPPFQAASCLVPRMYVINEDFPLSVVLHWMNNNLHSHFLQTVICWFANLSPLIKHCSFILPFQQHIQYGTIYVY